MLFKVTLTESPDTVDVKFVPPVIASLSPNDIVDSVELSSTIVNTVVLKFVLSPKFQHKFHQN